MAPTRLSRIRGRMATHCLSRRGQLMGTPDSLEKGMLSLEREDIGEGAMKIKRELPLACLKERRGGHPLLLYQN